ncbi:MAG: DUF3303 family protein, partial [Proteobacteria bacterium]|nr:DUF3303 family protein [Pseudomonadota bacterium]
MACDARHRRATRSWPKALGSRLYGSLLRTFGMTFVESWVEANCDRCFQIMECDDVRLLQVWAAHWRDLVEFEFVPVAPGKATAEALMPLLDRPLG